MCNVTTLAASADVANLDAVAGRMRGAERDRELRAVRTERESEHKAWEVQGPTDQLSFIEVPDAHAAAHLGRGEQLSRPICESLDAVGVGGRRATRRE